MRTAIYIEAQKIDLSEALKRMIEISLPRGSKNKILNIPLEYIVYNMKHKIIYFKKISIVAFRPMNYTFIGTYDSEKDITQADIKRYSYHDSCWSSDGIDRIVQQIAKEIDEKFSKKENEIYDVKIDIDFLRLRFYEGTITIPSDINVFSKFEKVIDF
jgi:hypothetical protein